MNPIFWVIPLAAFAIAFVTALLVGRVAQGTTAARLRDRLRAIKLEGDEDAAAPMIREKYLRRFSPVERRLEELPGMARIAHLIEQAGYSLPAYRMAALTVLIATVAAALTWWLSEHPALTALAVLVGLALPILQLYQKRTERLNLLEEQLPEALDMMARALRAGNPLTESFKFVAEEMDDPIAREFGTTWSQLNYGVSLRASFEDLGQRMPSTSLRAMATAILVQRETGGNLAEILDKISAVLRTRFRFQRKVRSLTAEGRMSAWVLILLPFGLSAMLSITSPQYLPMLTGDPIGRILIVVALALMIAGIFWIRRVIRIRL